MTSDIMTAREHLRLGDAIMQGLSDAGQQPPEISQALSLAATAHYTAAGAIARMMDAGLISDEEAGYVPPV
jgi:hypothetical protein